MNTPARIGLGKSTLLAIFTILALTLCSPAVYAQDSFRPLDTRTRCIVLFRECLVLTEKKDTNGIFQVVADSGAPKGSSFKLFPDLDSLSPDSKREIQDVDRFFKRNFKSAPLITRTFTKIQFSELVTNDKPVSVTNTANDKKGEAKLHSIKIKIPIPDTDPGLTHE